MSGSENVNREPIGNARCGVHEERHKRIVTSNFQKPSTDYTKEYYCGLSVIFLKTQSASPHGPGPPVPLTRK